MKAKSWGEFAYVGDLGDRAIISLEGFHLGTLDYDAANAEWYFHASQHFGGRCFGPQQGTPAPLMRHVMSRLIEGGFWVDTEESEPEVEDNVWNLGVAGPAFGGA